MEQDKELVRALAWQTMKLYWKELNVSSLTHLSFGELMTGHRLYIRVGTRPCHCMVFVAALKVHGAELRCMSLEKI